MTDIQPDIHTPGTHPDAATRGNTPPGLDVQAGRPGGAVPRWPLLLLGLPAVVAIWSGWVGLGGMCGFGPVDLLPGIRSGLHLNTAITLPVGMEVYAAYALRAWLAGNTGRRAREFARGSALAALGLGAAGQVAYHLMTAAGWRAAPWPVTIAVSCVPVAVLGMGAALAHLLREEDMVVPPLAAGGLLAGGLPAARDEDRPAAGWPVDDLCADLAGSSHLAAGLAALEAAMEGDVRQDNWVDIWPPAEEDKPQVSGHVAEDTAAGRPAASEVASQAVSCPVPAAPGGEDNVRQMAGHRRRKGRPTVADLMPELLAGRMTQGEAATQTGQSVRTVRRKVADARAGDGAEGTG